MNKGEDKLGLRPPETSLGTEVNYRPQKPIITIIEGDTSSISEPSLPIEALSSKMQNVINRPKEAPREQEETDISKRDLTLEDLTLVRVDTKTVGRSLQIINAFCEAHKGSGEPKKVLAYLFKEFFPNIEIPENPQSLIKEKWFRPLAEWTGSNEGFWQNLRQKVATVWKSMDSNNEHFFRKVEEFCNNPPYPLETALECPRSITPGGKLDLLSLGLDPEKVDMQDASMMLALSITYRNAFLEASREAIKNSSVNPFENDRQSRIIYTLEQLTVFFGNLVGELRHTGGVREVSTPSVKLVKENHEQKLIKKFIDATLMQLLIISDENKLIGVVQQDFILEDLKALAKEASLINKYRELFSAIEEIEDACFLINFPLKKSAEKKDRTASDFVSVRYLAEKFTEKNNRPPEIAVLGTGNGLTERVLINLGLAGRTRSVDVNHKSDDNNIQLDTKNNWETSTIGIAKHIEECPGGKIESSEVVELVMSALPGKFDIIIVNDVMHEISLKNRAIYIRHLIDKLRPGGTIYMMEPVYSEAIDDLTGETLNQYDGAINLDSMLSIESINDLAAYAHMKGVRMKNMNINSHSGHRDGLMRCSATFRKPRIDESEDDESKPLYFIPEDGIPKNTIIKKDNLADAILNIWPFSKISPTNAPNFSELLLNDPEFRKRLQEGITKADIRLLVAMSLSNQQGAEIQDIIEHSPCPDIDKIYEHTEDRELSRLVKEQGAIFLIGESVYKEFKEDILPDFSWPHRYYPTSL